MNSINKYIYIPYNHTMRLKKKFSYDMMFVQYILVLSFIVLYIYCNSGIYSTDTSVFE